MIFETESGARYEVADWRARKLIGDHTEMTAGGAWRDLRAYYVEVGAQALLVWTEPGRECGHRATETSRVVAVYLGGGES